MTNGEHTIKLGDQEHRVTLPGFAEREDIALGHAMEAGHPGRQQRILMTGLALCCPTLNAGTVEDYAEGGYEAVKFGNAAYNALRAQGLTFADIHAAAIKIYNIIGAATFPREAEVASKEGFIEAPAVAVT